MSFEAGNTDEPRMPDPDGLDEDERWELRKALENIKVRVNSPDDF